MGMDKYTHIGPYIQVPKINKAVTRIVRVDARGKETKFQFDPNTGKENLMSSITEDIINRPYPYPDGDDAAIEAWNASGIREDAFFQGEGLETRTHEIFLCNDMEFDFDDDEDIYASFLDLNPASELENFKEKYKAVIEYWEKEYGPVIVDYGIVSYWS